MASDKHEEFVSEPMRNKPATDIAGIGDKLGERLNAAGFTKAHKVFGQYLVLDKNERLFKHWLETKYRASSNAAAKCYACLNEWAEKHL